MQKGAIEKSTDYPFIKKSRHFCPAFLLPRKGALFLCKFFYPHFLLFGNQIPLFYLNWSKNRRNESSTPLNNRNLYMTSSKSMF